MRRQSVLREKLRAWRVGGLAILVALASSLTLIWLTVSAAALLGGCTPEPQRSVEWYLDHPDELRATLQACREKSQIESSASDNCARARQASMTDRPSGQRL